MINEIEFKKNIETLIANAKTKADLNFIGSKFNEVIDNGYNIDIWDYQLQAAKKMTEIYANLKKDKEVSVAYTNSEEAA